MSTIKKLANVLGVRDRTIRNHRNDGYAVVIGDDNKIDVDKSVHAFVKYQSETIRMMKAKNGRNASGISGNTKEPESVEEWKAEKEKQGAIKLRLQNEKDLGEMVPMAALFELYNKPLSLVKRQLLDSTNQLSKRLPVSIDTKKKFEDLIRDALDELNEKSLNELQPVIGGIIERHSKYYSAAAEGADDCMDDDE